MNNREMRREATEPVLQTYRWTIYYKSLGNRMLAKEVAGITYADAMSVFFRHNSSISVKDITAISQGDVILI